VSAAVLDPPAAAPSLGEALLLEEVEHRGMLDLYRAAPAAARAAGGLSATERDGVVCLRCDALPGSRMFNHAFGLGLDRPAGEDDLDRLAAAYGGRAHHVALSPAARPGELGDLLGARGYAPDYGWVKFRRGVEPLPAPPTDLRVVPADGRHAGAFGAIVAGAFGLPPFVAAWLTALPGRPGWSCLVALDGATPAAAGALYVAGGVGWVAFGATLPAHRGRGGQTAILAARVARAAELGCTALAVETGARGPGRVAASYRNILAAGFAPRYLRPNLRSPEPSAG
jgi:GNAT superfamily N-acetyltransferase